MTSPPSAVDGPIIRLEAIHKHYATGSARVHALRGIDLAVDPGESVAIMGPSGSGKTTLMEIVGCLSQPTSGRYVLAGRSVEEISPDGLARIRGEEIGFVFQSFNLLPRLSVAENVELPLAYRGVGRRERRQRALAALERVGLADRSTHLPSEISGGQRQRVAIARALVNQPRLVLADEPTGNLDTTTGDEIMALLREVHAAGSTVLVVTHNPHIGDQVARKLWIHDGRIVSDVAGADAC